MYTVHEIYCELLPLAEWKHFDKTEGVYSKKSPVTHDIAKSL